MIPTGSYKLLRMLRYSFSDVSSPSRLSNEHAGGLEFGEFARTVRRYCTRTYGTTCAGVEPRQMRPPNDHPDLPVRGREDEPSAVSRKGQLETNRGGARSMVDRCSVDGAVHRGRELLPVRRYE